MMRWLEDNPIGQVLAAVAAGLVVVMLALGVVWSLPPGAGETAPPADAEARLRVEVSEMAGHEPIEAYAVVSERPVFNESRQPELVADADAEDAEGAAEEPADAPDLQLAGVVITPSLRMVTLRPKNSGQSLVAFEGQPLQGDYGSWHVSRIAPREITLASGYGEELQLQLQIHDAVIKPPPKPEPAEVAEEKSSDSRERDDDEDDRPLTRAEEIRQRIAERREELRRAAEEEQSGEREQSEYQTAIQAMMGARRRSQENSDEE
jgi:hypothetical protein